MMLQACNWLGPEDLNPIEARYQAALRRSTTSLLGNTFIINDEYLGCLYAGKKTPVNRWVHGCDIP